MRMAIDTGGTFTDCVFVRDGKLRILKVPSQRATPEEAIAAWRAIEQEFGEADDAALALATL